MAPKSVQTAPETPAGDPKHAARATRTAGRQMRSRLLDGASRLFKERGLAGTSISDIAAAADAFPSQITYYFRTKEALFVEAACRDVLYVARAAEQAALLAQTPRAYTRALVETRDGDGFGRPLCRSADTDPPPPGSRTAGRTHHRAAARRRDARLCRPDRRHGWNSLRDPDASSRRFWAIAIGVMVEGHAMGRSAGRNVRRDAARAGRPGDDEHRRRNAGCVWSATAYPFEFTRRGGIIMTALRMRARDFLNEDQLRRGQRVTWKGCPDRACVGADIGFDRAGGVVAQSADLFAGGRHHRLAPAWPCDPDA